MKIIFNDDHQYELSNIVNDINSLTKTNSDKWGNSVYIATIVVGNTKVTDMIPEIKNIFLDEENLKHVKIDKENGEDPFEFKFGTLISLKMYSSQQGFFINLSINRPESFILS